VEAANATGFVSRLIAEQGNPQADVFWNGEFAQTMLLKQRGLLAPHDSASTKDLPARFVDAGRFWSGVGGRCRVLAIQSRLAPPGVRASIESLLDPDIPSHRVGIAYPPVGTTATHAAALYAAQGEESARWFFQRLRTRGVRVLDNNNELRDQIAGWQLAIGLTDSDVGCKAVAKDGPVVVALPDQDSIGTLLIPGTVALIKGAPHPAEGKQLIDHLLSAETERRLIGSGFAQFSLRDVRVPYGCLEGRKIKLMDVSLEDAYRRYEICRSDLEQIFVR
jgi:iron(III) transport system substrate-binding protein